MRKYHCYILHVTVSIYMFVVQSCSQSASTYGICCMVAETISVICSERSYRHGALDLALMLDTCL